MMKPLSEKITELAKNALPKAEGNSCYLDMDKGVHDYSSAVWLFPDGTFRSAPYTRSYTGGKEVQYKEHTMVYETVFRPLRDRFKRARENGEKPIYPETSEEINRMFKTYTGAMRVRCKRSKRDHRKELLVELSTDIPPTEKQMRAIRRELCEFDYDLFYYDITDTDRGDGFWTKTFGGTVAPTCTSAFRNMQKDWKYIKNHN